MRYCISLMPRTSISLKPKTAACLRYLAAQQLRSVSNLIERLTWDAFREWTDHWKPEEVQQVLDSLDSAYDRETYTQHDNA
jgi:hypothetical protein